MSTTHPILEAEAYLADAGLETSLIYDDGLDVPDFAAFLLLAEPAGRDALRRYYQRYAAIAAEHGVGALLDTPTWRASTDWGARHGYDAEAMATVNRDAVGFVREAAASVAGAQVLVSGVIGPRGDGYQVGERMSAAEARTYHGVQARAFAEASADIVVAVTMTYPEEAIGVADAARAAEMPVAVSFTVETDGRLPCGTDLGEAIEAVDAATDAYPAYFMVNCAHPTHFDAALAAGDDWVGRIGGIRANASTASHAELDEATELDPGDPADLAERYAALRVAVPSIKVLGGCCGTNHEHVTAIAARCVGGPVSG